MSYAYWIKSQETGEVSFGPYETPNEAARMRENLPASGRFEILETWNDEVSCTIAYDSIASVPPSVYELQASGDVLLVLNQQYDFAMVYRITGLDSFTRPYPQHER